MLSSLSIAHFRGIRSLRVERVGHVNLLVGANNVGKSTVLEALSLYGAKLNDVPVSLVELLRRRHDLSRPGVDVLDAARRLFFEGDSDQVIRIGQERPSEADLRVATGWQRLSPEDGIALQSLRGSWREPPPGELRPVLLADRDGRSSHVSLNPTPRTGDVSLNAGHPRRADRRLVRLLDPTLDLGEMNRPWDQVALTDREDEVISALRLIEADIERVVLVEDPLVRRDADAAPSHRLPFVRRRTGPGRASQVEPLRSLGDGMGRLFELALGLVTSADGLFLLDEAENGLHYLVLDDLWRFVFQLAARMNVQVFATTHSADCLAAFARAALESEQEGAVVRLSREAGDLYSTVYSESDLEVVAKHRLEIR